NNNNNNPSNNNNQPSASNNPQIPNEAGGNPSTGTSPSPSANGPSGPTSPSANGPSGPSPFSPLAPMAIDPSIPRDITIYQQYRSPGQISPLYGTQVGKQCIVEIENNQTIISNNLTQTKTNIKQAIFQQSGQKVELSNMMVIGNMSIVTIDNCDTNTLGNLTNTNLANEGQLDLYGEIAAAQDDSIQTTDNQTSSNSTYKKTANPKNKTSVETTNDKSLQSNSNQTKKPKYVSTNMDYNTNKTVGPNLNAKQNFTWTPDLPITLSEKNNDTIKKIIQNMSEENINSTITKETLYNVTFYQFTPLDITRTVLNNTNVTILDDGTKIIAVPDINETSQTIPSTVSNKTSLPSDTDKEPIDIVIVDTGVSQTHPDLSIYRSLSFVNGTISIDSKDTDDRNGHGSHIAGIINAKDNGFGIVGIAPQDNVRIWSLKVCSDEGVCATSDQLKAIEYITLNADIFDVVNYSIENPHSKLLEKAISESVKAGIPYVVAAGNFAKNATLTTSPASNPDVITVSAIGDSDGKCGGLGPALDNGRILDDTFANFSNFGSSVDVAAPGVDIISTYNGTNYGILSGTSMAVPHVTGLAALLMMQYPNLNPEDLKEMIVNSGSNPTSECLENKGIGYFTRDLDNIHEPLVLLPKKMITNSTQLLLKANIEENQTELSQTSYSQSKPSIEKSTTISKGKLADVSNNSTNSLSMTFTNTTNNNFIKNE
ncbi:MAG: S8 family serine peptidase, partial [Nitrososphaeraceae archaeon]